MTLPTCLPACLPAHPPICLLVVRLISTRCTYVCVSSFITMKLIIIHKRNMLFEKQIFFSAPWFILQVPIAALVCRKVRNKACQYNYFASYIPATCSYTRMYIYGSCTYVPMCITALYVAIMCSRGLLYIEGMCIIIKYGST